jgi:hypothetical protein
MDCTKRIIPYARKGDFDMSNNFAYVEGQEIEALDYFEKRLQITLDKDEQAALVAVVENLRKKILEKHGHLPKPAQNILTLSAV